MLKTTIVTFIFLLVFVSSAFAQNSCNKFSEPTLFIAFCAPLEWKIVKDEGDKYQTAYGAESDGITPTMNIEAGTYRGKLAEYVKKVLIICFKTTKRKPV